MTAALWFLAGVIVGQVTLAVSLALTRGARPGRVDEHEGGV